MVTLAIVVGAIVAVAAVCYGLGILSCRRDWMVVAAAALVFAPVLAHTGAPGGFVSPLPAAPTIQDARLANPIGAAVPQLIAGLEAIPGCLGVELVQTASGKQAVFAWFENKRALMRFYSSEAHLRAIQAVFPGYQSSGTTLKDLSDDAGPILAVASVVFADSSQTTPGAPPFRQISIEYYAPMSGGIAVGGRFAPSALKVPGLREIVPPTGPADRPSRPGGSW